MSVARESGQARSVLFRHFIFREIEHRQFSQGPVGYLRTPFNVRDSSANGTPIAITVGSEGAPMLVRAGRRVSRASGGVIRPWLAPWFSASDSVRSGGGARVDPSGAAGFVRPGAGDGFPGGRTTGTIAGPILATTSPRSFWRSALEALERAIEPSATPTPGTPVTVSDDAQRDDSHDATDEASADPSDGLGRSLALLARLRTRKPPLREYESDARWPKPLSANPKVEELLKRQGLFAKRTGSGALSRLWPKRILAALRRCGEDRSQADRWNEDDVLWLLRNARGHPRLSSREETEKCWKDKSAVREYIAMLSLYAGDASPLALAKSTGSDEVMRAARAVPLGWTGLAFRDRSGNAPERVPFGPKEWYTHEKGPQSRRTYSRYKEEPTRRPVFTERLLYASRDRRDRKDDINGATGDSLRAHRFRWLHATHLVAITRLWGVVSRKHGFIPAPQASVLGSYTHVALAADAQVALSRHIEIDDGIDEDETRLKGPDETANPPQTVFFGKLSEPFDLYTKRRTRDGVVRLIQNAVEGWHDMATLWGPDRSGTIPLAFGVEHGTARSGAPGADAASRRTFHAMVPPVELAAMTNAFIHFAGLDSKLDQDQLSTWARLNSLWSRCTRASDTNWHYANLWYPGGPVKQHYLRTHLTRSAGCLKRPSAAPDFWDACAVTAHPSGRQVTVRKTRTLEALLDVIRETPTAWQATDILCGAAEAYCFAYFGGYNYPAPMSALASHVLGVADHLGTLADAGALSPPEALRSLVSIAQFQQAMAMAGGDTSGAAGTWLKIMNVVAEAAAADGLSPTELSRALLSWGKHLEAIRGVEKVDGTVPSDPIADDEGDLGRLNALVDAFARSVTEATPEDLHGVAVALDRFIDRYSDNPHALAFTDGGESIRAIAREAAARIVPTMAREATRRKSAHELVKTIHRGFGRGLGELPQFRQRPLPIEFKHAMNHARDRLALHAAATADASALQAHALRFTGEDAGGTPPPAPDEFFARSSAVAAAARDGLLPTIVLARAMRAWARVRAATAGGLIADEADVAAVYEALEAASSSEGGLHEETVRTLEEAEALFRRTIAIETNSSGGATLGDDVEDENPENPEVEVDEVDEEQDEEHDATPDLSADAAIEFEAVKDDWLARLPKTKAAKLLEAIDACADDLEVMEAVAASAEEDATKVRAGARARVLEATAKLRVARS